MEKINFKNGQAPALNATNLNQLQTNIENGITESSIFRNLWNNDMAKKCSVYRCGRR